MGFRNGAYATVWKVEPISDTMTKTQISISRKDKSTGNYETDFSGFAAFIGSATAKKASQLKERDRIRLGDVDVTTKYDKDKQVTYTNYKVFSFEVPDAVDNPSSRADSSSDPSAINVDDGAAIEDALLPF